MYVPLATGLPYEGGCMVTCIGVDICCAVQHAPLVVLNGFGMSEHAHVKLMRAAFQNMFPTVNVDTIKLAECRRVVLFHVNKQDETVELRHYAIKATPVGISKSVKKLVQSSQLPDLGRLDVSTIIYYKFNVEDRG
jgi:ribosome biogenesis protein SSF1/2